MGAKNNPWQEVFALYTESNQVLNDKERLEIVHSMKNISGDISRLQNISAIDGFLWIKVFRKKYSAVLQKIPIFTWLSAYQTLKTQLDLFFSAMDVYPQKVLYSKADAVLLNFFAAPLDKKFLTALGGGLPAYLELIIHELPRKKLFDIEELEKQSLPSLQDYNNMLKNMIQQKF